MSSVILKRQVSSLGTSGEVFFIAENVWISRVFGKGVSKVVSTGVFLKTSSSPRGIVFTIEEMCNRLNGQQSLEREIIDLSPESKLGSMVYHVYDNLMSWMTGTVKKSKSGHPKALDPSVVSRGRVIPGTVAFWC